MGLRARFLSAVAGWFALVTVALAAPPLMLRERLPDPLATHWGVSGGPDGSMPFAAFLLFEVGVWAVVAGVPLVSVLVRPGQLRRRSARMGLGALLGGSGLFFLGLQAVTLSANLDAPVWWRAAPLGWGALVAILGLVAGGWLGALAARPGPDDGPEATAGVRRLSLGADQRAVWVSSVRNVPLAALGGSLLAAGTGYVVFALLGGEGILWSVAGTLAFVGLVGLIFSSVRVQVTEEGIVLFYGPLRLPRWHVPIRRVERAWSEERYPSGVGGWGIRGLPGSVTVMLRGGECLVLGYVSGGRLAISIDDAENGAALVNTLVARESTGPGAR
ncbi:DUF1648 domain-containing protein [Streptosporangium sp. NPDC023615]|uniref:DUF1648 domain-containing protein n=1 Tax=Streptosporangium sp. NPDC023615 TaxID=3154794 RepID=UPI003436EE18